MNKLHKAYAHDPDLAKDLNSLRSTLYIDPTDVACGHRVNPKPSLEQLDRLATRPNKRSNRMRYSLITIFALGAVHLIGCDTTNPDIPRILEQNGYKNVQLTGYAPFMCSDNDWTKEGFKATAPSGQVVLGAVCGGGTKGYTIRFK